jgi:hypothetical protein
MSSKNTNGADTASGTTKRQTFDKKETPFIEPEHKEETIMIEKGEFEPVIYKEYDLNDVVYVILNALQHISDIQIL